MKSFIDYGLRSGVNLLRNYLKLGYTLLHALFLIPFFKHLILT